MSKKLSKEALQAKEHLLLIRNHIEILLFSKKDDFSGIVLRDKGYSELIHASSKFQIDQKGEFNLFTDYYSTICEERIAFLSQNIRFRYSIIKSKIHDSIIQTSHSSEIRKII